MTGRGRRGRGNDWNGGTCAVKDTISLDRIGKSHGVSRHADQSVKESGKLGDLNRLGVGGNRNYPAIEWRGTACIRNARTSS